MRVLETGTIYLFARLPVEEPEELSDPAVGLDGFRNLYIVLSPYDQPRFRLISARRNDILNPRASGVRSYRAAVDAVEEDPRKLTSYLREGPYDFETEEPEVQAAVRRIGEGAYRILRHGNHTHLIYVLAQPEEHDDAQEELQIAGEASYIVGIENPKKAMRPNVESPEEGVPDYPRALFPRALAERLRGHAYGALDPPDYLNFEGAHFLLSSDPEVTSDTLGVDLDAEDERESVEGILRDLRLRNTEFPIHALLEGELSQSLRDH